MVFHAAQPLYNLGRGLPTPLAAQSGSTSRPAGETVTCCNVAIKTLGLFLQVFAKIRSFSQLLTECLNSQVKVEQNSISEIFLVYSSKIIEYILNIIFDSSQK